MTAKITYLLTEQAQRDAMAATGQPVARTQTIEAEIPTTDLDLLSISADGTYYSLVWRLRDAYAAAIAQDEASAAAEQAKITAEAEYDFTAATALDALQQTSEADRVRRTPTTDPVHPRSLTIPTHQPLTRTALAAYCARWDAQRKAEADAATAAEEAKEQAKLAVIDAWMRDYGTLLQQARHADGLMPRAEATKLMAAWVMDSYSVPAEDDRQVCTKRECPCSESGITTLSETDYEAWAAIRNKLPGNHTVSFWRVTECPPTDQYGDRDEACADTHTAAYIAIPYGPFRFERQVILADSIL